MTVLGMAFASAVTFLGGWLLTRDSLWGPAAAVALVLFSLSLALTVGRALQRWTLARVEGALARGEARDLRRLVRLYAAQFPPYAVPARVRLVQASVLVLEERWREARTVLERLDRAMLSADDRARYDDQHALAAALSGDAAATTRVRTLARALDATAPADARRPIVCFHLGEAHRALGHHAEASAAYREAIACAPEGRYAERARLRLAEPVQPYR
jgi:hypothetical protein